MKYSIIIATYNSGKYIKKCIESILNQTLKNFNIIIVDDGSTDNTKEVLKPYLKLKNVKYFYKENTGVADTRNFGISKVKTEYFMFIDSDDYISPTLFETIEKYNNYDILSFKGKKIDENDNLIMNLEKGVFDIIDGENYLKDLIINNHFFLVPWGYVYNTKFWNKNRLEYEKYYVMEDAGLTPIAILNAKKVISIDYYGYYYVQTNESITRTKNERKIKLNIESILFQYDYLINYIENNNYCIEFKIIFKNYFSKFLLWYGSTLSKKYSKKYIKELKKRKINKELKRKNLKTIIKKIICKINYKLYFKLYNFVHRKDKK